MGTRMEHPSEGPHELNSDCDPVQFNLAPGDAIESWHLASHLRVCHFRTSACSLGVRRLPSKRLPSLAHTVS